MNLHEVDLGPPIEAETLRLLIRSQWDSELVRGMMQAIRSFAYDAIAEAKAGAKAQNDAWVHAQLGRHDACEAIVVSFHKLTENEKPEPEA